MVKVRWRFILLRAINALLVLSFCALGSTGLVLFHALPPGSGRHPPGSGWGRPRDFLTLLGKDRHEWGEFHAAAAAVFFVLLLVHLGVHAGWLRAVAWGTKEAPRPLWQRVLTLAILAFLGASVILPLAAVPETGTLYSSLSAPRLPQAGMRTE